MEQKARLELVQYTRGVAALLVLISHWSRCLIDVPGLNVQLSTLIDAPSAVAGNLLATAVKVWGQYAVPPFDVRFASGGVLIFFLISGFVIALSVETLSLRQFAIRRVFRLLPLAATVVLLIVLVNVVLSMYALATPRQIPPGQVLTNALLINDWFWHPLIDLGYWTLLVEVKFYALLAGLVALSKDRKLHPAILVAACACLAAICAPYSSLGAPSAMENLYQAAPASGHPFVFYFFRVLTDNAPFFPFMMCGTMLFFWHHRRITLAQLVAYVGVLFAFFVSLFVIKPNGVTQLYYVGDGLRALVLVTGVIASQRFLDERGKVVASLRSLRFLGDISYSLYLVHGTLGMTLLLWLYQRTGSANLALALGFPVVLVVSWALFTYVETPGIRAGRRFSGGRA